MSSPSFDNVPPAWARQLGYAGLLPFVLLTAGVWMGYPDAGDALVAYAATITSFLGAIHWGLTMRDAQPDAKALSWGVVPSLVAWLALMMDTDDALMLMAALLVTCWLVDRQAYVRWGVGAWLRLRTELTLVATLCCSLSSLMF